MKPVFEEDRLTAARFITVAGEVFRGWELCLKEEECQAALQISLLREDFGGSTIKIEFLLRRIDQVEDGLHLAERELKR